MSNLEFAALATFAGIGVIVVLAFIFALFADWLTEQLRGIAYSTGLKRGEENALKNARCPDCGKRVEVSNG